jgi:hypothetical protein
MIRTILFSLLSCSAFLVFSQNDISKKPEDYNINDETLSKVFSDAWTEEYSFVSETNRSIIEVDTTIQDMTKFSYNPHMKLGKRWTFVAKEGVEASKGELEIFLNTSHKKAVKNNKFKITELIKREYVQFDSIGTDYIVFSFQIPENKLPEEYKFVQYIKGFILISKETKKFEKIALELTQPAQGINYFLNTATAEYFYKYDKENDLVILLKHTLNLEIKEEDGTVYTLEQIDTYTRQVYVGLSEEQKKEKAKKEKKLKK